MLKLTFPSGSRCCAVLGIDRYIDIQIDRRYPGFNWVEYVSGGQVRFQEYVKRECALKFLASVIAQNKRRAVNALDIEIIASQFE